VLSPSLLGSIEVGGHLRGWLAGRKFIWPGYSRVVGGCWCRVDGCATVGGLGSLQEEIWKTCTEIAIVTKETLGYCG
jgi:hypothetical protein